MTFVNNLVMGTNTPSPPTIQPLLGFTPCIHPPSIHGIEYRLHPHLERVFSPQRHLAWDKHNPLPAKCQQTENIMLADPNDGAPKKGLTFFSYEAYFRSSDQLDFQFNAEVVAFSFHTSIEKYIHHWKFYFNTFHL